MSPFKFVFLLIALLALPARAVDWEQLTPEQRSVLAPYEQSWKDLDVERQNNMIRGADRWLTMGDPARAQISERYAAFMKLKLARRTELLRRLRDFQELTPAQQRQLRNRLRAFRSLTPMQQRRLRDQFKNLRPRERAAALQALRRRAEMQRQRNQADRPRPRG